MARSVATMVGRAEPTTSIQRASGHPGGSRNPSTDLDNLEFMGVDALLADFEAPARTQIQCGSGFSFSQSNQFVHATSARPVGHTDRSRSFPWFRFLHLQAQRYRSSLASSGGRRA